MLDEGVEPLIILARDSAGLAAVVRRKSRWSGKRSAKDVAMAAMVPAWKARDFAASCRKYEWKRLAAGFRLVAYCRPGIQDIDAESEGYFDVMLWKMIG